MGNYLKLLAMLASAAPLASTVLPFGEKKQEAASEDEHLLNSIIDKSKQDYSESPANADAGEDSNFDKQQEDEQKQRRLRAIRRLSESQNPDLLQKFNRPPR